MAGGKLQNQTAFEDESKRVRARVFTRVVPSMKRGGVKQRIFYAVINKLRDIWMLRGYSAEYPKGKIRDAVRQTLTEKSRILANTSLRELDALRDVAPLAAVDIDNHAIPAQQELLIPVQEDLEIPAQQELAIPAQELAIRVQEELDIPAQQELLILVQEEHGIPPQEEVPAGLEGNLMADAFLHDAPDPKGFTIWRQLEP